MVVSCVVYNCRSYGTDGIYRFYCIPREHKSTDEATKHCQREQRSAWIKALMLDYDPPRYIRVCSRHFVSGKPAALYDVNAVDWIPNLHIPNAHGSDPGLSDKLDQNENRLRNSVVAYPCLNQSLLLNSGAKRKSCEESSVDILSTHTSNYQQTYCNQKVAAFKTGTSAGIRTYQPEIEQNVSEDSNINFEINCPGQLIDGDDYEYQIMAVDDILDAACDLSYYPDLQTCSLRFAAAGTEMNNLEHITLLDSTVTSAITQNGIRSNSSTGGTTLFSDVSVQTEECSEKDIRRLQTALHHSDVKLKKTVSQVLKAKRKIESLRSTTRLTVTSLTQDDKKCKYFTGLKSGLVLKHLYDALGNDVPSFSELSREEALVLALRKLRLNEPYCTLGYSYNIQPSVLSNYFNETIDGIYFFMKGLVRFPSRDVLRQHMPLSFKRKYNESVTVIIDCFEIAMESPNSKAMKANANVYSNYKKHKTVKVLLGISASGNIIYVSETFGGRTSDKEIVKLSGFLSMIHEGDFVMADRGFLIDELVVPLGASVSYPAFKKKNHQLEPLDAVSSKELSSLRIHVERVIGSLRQKYLILSDNIPISLIQRWNNDQPVIDQILMVAAGLVNLCPSVVSL